MTDKYVEKQMHFYEKATCERAKDDALYRIGTHLEIEGMECNGNTNLTDKGREVILKAANEVKNG
jgi:hypothetical protein